MIREAAIDARLNCVAHAPGRERAWRSLATPPEGEFVLRLPRAATGSAIEGLVLDPAGRPVSGACVTLGGDATRTSEAGRFAIDARELERGSTLRAVHLGHQPAQLELDGRRAAR